MNEHSATIIPIETDATDTAIQELIATDDAGNGADNGAGPSAVIEKLRDALTPGYQAEFDPAEAEAAGAFQEDALSEGDALASSHDTLHFTEPAELAQALLYAPPRSGMGVHPVLRGAFYTRVKK
ncbi:hypothetical protein [Massilia sp. TSP1-1-2]|uniref:hypothetical protein n=1 Tax=Massilia sp. TSP1-1-2 TaxID=2804649 RepID=UPI003CF948F1